MEHITNKFGAIMPKTSTKSYIKFATEISSSEILNLFINIGGEYILKNIEEVKGELIEIFEDPGNEIAEKLITQIKSGELDDHIGVEKYELFYGQMSYARLIDNVLTYFKDILSEIIIKKPEILKSKETEKLDYILNFDTMEDMKKAISEKKIEALFYAGIDTIENYFIQRLGIQLFKSKATKKEFNQAIKNRNLIVHNRGIVSKEYIKDFPESNVKIDEKLKFTYLDISRVNLILANFIVVLDLELSTKFQLDIVKD